MDEPKHLDNPRATPELLTAITTLMQRRGLKGLTMDSVACNLSMSKRTLYEIFDSKREMFLAAFDFNHKKILHRFEEIFNASPDVMRAMLDIFIFQRDMMEKVSCDFFRDMDDYFPELKKRYHEEQRRDNESIEFIYKKGVEEGVFRPDLNFLLTCTLLKVQMESLKRMEDNFPQGLTLLQAYDGIIAGFLRSIASPKGMRIVDDVLNNLHPMQNSLKNKSEIK
ncbi:MAG: TetR/AcrR family transcriptional regulator [Muribaculaceae bacterium]|nr:TetR/AcrR family transcriptional regulator [Muribaculaceae bacterium]